MKEHGRTRRAGRAAALAAGLSLACGAAFAADRYVSNDGGDDARDGLTPATAFANLAKALEAAGAGDTVHLVPTGKPYRQTVDFYGHPGGEPGRPLVFDGHGATLTGAEPCPPDGWRRYDGDTLVREDLVSTGFLLAEGEMVFMTRPFDVLRPGEVCYDPAFFRRLFFRPPAGRAASACRVEVEFADGRTAVLDPGGWQPSHSPLPGVLRYNGLDAPARVRLDGREAPLVHARDRLEPGAWTREDGAMYYRPPEGRAPEALDLRCIVRANGVQLGGSMAHVLVRNVNVEHVHNDGFNIHGEVTGARFENCNARQCGDEGFSAHDACETTLDGAVYEACDNGIANVNTAGFSVTRNVLIARSRHVGFLVEPREGAHHEVTNAVLVDNPAQLSGGRLTVENALIVRTADGPRSQALRAGSVGLALRRVTVAGGHAGLLRVEAGGRASLEDAVLEGGQGRFHVRSADPAAALSLKDVLYGADLEIEWGERPPWKRLPLSGWAADAPGCAPADIAFPGTLPGDSGCTRALVERYENWLAAPGAARRR